MEEREALENTCSTHGKGPHAFQGVDRGLCLRYRDEIIQDSEDDMMHPVPCTMDVREGIHWNKMHSGELPPVSSNFHGEVRHIAASS